MFGLSSIGRIAAGLRRGGPGAVAGSAAAGLMRGRSQPGAAAGLAQRMTGSIQGSPLGGADEAKLPVGDRSATEPRTQQRGIDVNRPMDYRGQLSDLRRSTRRHQRRAGRSLSR